MIVGKFTLEADLLHRGQVREMLSVICMDFPELKWAESKGLISSLFIVKGPKKIVLAVYKTMKKYF